jgi:hypothetical protein
MYHMYSTEIPRTHFFRGRTSSASSRIELPRNNGYLSPSEDLQLIPGAFYRDCVSCDLKINARSKDSSRMSRVFVKIGLICSRSNSPFALFLSLPFSLFLSFSFSFFFSISLYVSLVSATFIFHGWGRIESTSS